MARCGPNRATRKQGLDLAIQMYSSKSLRQVLHLSQFRRKARETKRCVIIRKLLTDWGFPTQRDTHLHRSLTCAFASEVVRGMRGSTLRTSLLAESAKLSSPTSHPESKSERLFTISPPPLTNPRPRRVGHIPWAPASPALA
jgi:hypothetical protein